MTATLSTSRVLGAIREQLLSLAHAVTDQIVAEDVRHRALIELLAHDRQLALEAAAVLSAATPVLDATPLASFAEVTITAAALAIPVSVASPPRAEPEVLPSRGGRPRKHDYAAIAECCRKALAERQGVERAVAEEFGVSSHSAKNLIRAARNAGHEIPVAPRGHRQKVAPPAVDDGMVPLGEEQDYDPDDACADAEALAALEADLAEMEATDPEVNAAAQQLADAGLGDPPPPLRVRKDRVRPVLVRDGEGIAPPLRTIDPNEPPAKAKKAPPEPMTWPTPPPKRQPMITVLDDDPVDASAALPQGLTLRMVADDYKALWAAGGGEVVRRLADGYGVHRSRVQAWLGRCREQGLLPPRDQPPVELVSPAGALPKSRFQG